MITAGWLEKVTSYNVNYSYNCNIFLSQKLNEHNYFFDNLSSKISEDTCDACDEFEEISRNVFSPIFSF